MSIYEFGEAVWKGIASIPTDLYYGARRTGEDLSGFMGSGVAAQNRVERDRALALIKDAIRERRKICRMIEIILDFFFSHAPDGIIDKAHAKTQAAGAGKVSRTSTKVLLSRAIATRLTAKIGAKLAVKAGVGATLNILLLQGLLERSSDASKRLASANPQLYRLLKNENLDLLYFLVEDELAPVVNATMLKRLDTRRYREIMADLEKHLE